MRRAREPAGHAQMQGSLAGHSEEFGFCPGCSGKLLEGVKDGGDVPDSHFTKMTGHSGNG